MLTNLVHVCIDQPGYPDPEAEFEMGSRHICSCGSNFVYREGFNTSGQLGMPKTGRRRPSPRPSAPC